MTSAPIGPVPPPQRLVLLDALRGFALAGILMANLYAFSLYTFLPRAVTPALPTAALDRLLMPLQDALVNGKFIGLFSLMFGIGLVLQARRAGGEPGHAARQLRRLAVLGLLGLVHALVWWGDVLRWYAVIGLLLLLLPLLRLRPRTLACLGVALASLPHLLPAAWWPWPPGITLAQAHAAALVDFSRPGVPALLHANAAFSAWWLPAHWDMALSVAGRMLVGAAIARSGLLHDPAAHARAWRRLLWLLPAGLAIMALLAALDYGRLALPAGWHPAGAVRRTLEEHAALMLTLGYAALFVRLFAAPRARRVLASLAPAGRMALSNYLAQTVACVTLFYGVGLGIGPRYGSAGILLAWATVFAAQLALSHWWLARWRFGPAEWAWRSLTYGRLQPMRRARAQAGDVRPSAPEAG